MNALRVGWCLLQLAAGLAWALAADLLSLRYHSIRAPDGSFTRAARFPRWRRRYAEMHGLPLGQLECDVKAWELRTGGKPRC